MSELQNNTDSKKTGGLLKLDQTTHNELISKMHNLQARESSRNQAARSSRSNNESEDRTDRPIEKVDPNAKMLFNPNNPNKPIYVASKRSPANYVSNSSNKSADSTKKST